MSPDRKWKHAKNLGDREPRSCGMVWRILLSASILAVIAFAAITPSALKRNTALLVTVCLGSMAAAVQFYIIVTRFVRCLPYSIWAVVALDGLCVVGWCVAVAVLSYWHREVLYKPQAGDPSDWLYCYQLPDGYDVYDVKYGGGQSINIVWCQVEVDGQQRLIGNGVARLQHRSVIGLSAVALFFDAIVFFISLRKQRDPNWGNV